MSASGLTSTGIAFEHAQGPGVPVVLIHAGVADRRMWDPQWSDLADRRAVVRLDLRGFGDSIAPPDGELSHVDDVLGTLDHLGIDRCHFVGASLGAGVAVEAALTRPGVAESLLLCPPGGSLLAELTADLRRFIDEETTALDDDDLDAAVEANVRAWLVGPRRDPAQLDDSVIATVRRMQRRAFEIPASWPADVAEAEIDPPALDRLGEITARTLVLIGGHDLETTLDAAERVTSGIAGARRVDWQDAAHLPSMERPEEFLELVLEWTAADAR